MDSARGCACTDDPALIALETKTLILLSRFSTKGIPFKTNRFCRSLASLNPLSLFGHLIARCTLALIRALQRGEKQSVVSVCSSQGADHCSRICFRRTRKMSRSDPTFGRKPRENGRLLVVIFTRFLKSSSGACMATRSAFRVLESYMCAHKCNSHGVRSQHQKKNGRRD
jgi:hypothetical protein